MKTLKSVLLLLTVISFAFFYSCDSQKEQVVANIEGLGNDTVYVRYMSFPDYLERKNEIADTIVATQGRFAFDLPADVPLIGYITPKSMIYKRNSGRDYISDAVNMSFVLDAGEKMTIQGKITPGFLTYEVKQPGLNRDLSLFRSDLKESILSIDSLEMLIDYYTHDSSAPQFQDSLIRTLYEERNQYNENRQKIQQEYIRENPTSPVSAFLVYQQRKNVFREYYEILDPALKEGLLKPLLDSEMKAVEESEARVNNIKTVVKGAMAPEFTLKNPEGKDVSLVDLKGKYIVLDFWGSWCGWCIKGFPKMKEYYKKYKNQVEFVGIACRDSEEKWIDAVKKHELPWLQLRNIEDDMDKNLSIVYGIEGFPTKIILDKELKIIEKFLGESDEFYKALDNLSK